MLIFGLFLFPLTGSAISNTSLEEIRVLTRKEKSHSVFQEYAKRYDQEMKQILKEIQPKIAILLKEFHDELETKHSLLSSSTSK